jgi:A/G-specific adenine glycosylase
MNAHERKFVAIVQQYYAEHGRYTLPWRKTHNPYRILVSEIMLQQTQVERVIPKYQNFLKLFPTVEALAAASLGAVLIAWQGLGYNRRAKMLHACAQVVVSELKGRWPKSSSGLVALPGVGPYTASAVLAFAYNVATPLIETNVRTVYIHHFFPDALAVPDSDLLPIIERTLDVENPREWYAALMDYGSHLKVSVGNKSQRSKHHAKQSTFVGSNRQIRGVIVRQLATEKSSVSAAQIRTALGAFEVVRIQVQLDHLVREGMVVYTKRKYQLPT